MGSLLVLRKLKLLENCYFINKKMIKIFLGTTSYYQYCVLTYAMILKAFEGKCITTWKDIISCWVFWINWKLLFIKNTYYEAVELNKTIHCTHWHLKMEWELYYPNWTTNEISWEKIYVNRKISGYLCFEEYPSLFSRKQGYNSNRSLSIGLLINKPNAIGRMAQCILLM
jgi:hypothetical protein